MKENNGKRYGNTSEQLQVKRDKLMAIINILNSSESDEEKTFRIYKMYATPEKFRAAYSMIYKNGRNDEMFEVIIEGYVVIYNKLLEFSAKGYYENAKRRAKIEGYLNNYNHAKEVIINFIKNGSKYYLDEFLFVYGITKDDFEFCLKTISLVDEDLYNEYKLKLKNDVIIELTNDMNGCKKLADAIVNGYFADGTKMDVLEFWRCVPFKKRGICVTKFLDYTALGYNVKSAISCVRRLDNFTANVLPNENKIIMDYAKKNNLHDIFFVTESDLRAKYGRMNSYVDGVTLTSEDLENMIMYIQLNDYPLSYEVYELVRRKYINGEIDLKLLKNQKNNLNKKLARVLK